METSAPPAATKILPGLAGVAGEYFVAAELSRRGLIASISLRNTRGIDILATNADAKRSVTIQCKTKQSARVGWIMDEKGESFEAPNHFYVFVALGLPLERPHFHVVPSAAVAAYLRASYQAWFTTPGRGGRVRRATRMRVFEDPTNEYRERWELLGLG